MMMMIMINDENDTNQETWSLVLMQYDTFYHQQILIGTHKGSPESAAALLPSRTQLSPYLRFGCLSPKMYYKRLTMAYIKVCDVQKIYILKKHLGKEIVKYSRFRMSRKNAANS
jgi:hypothetical protein